MREQNKLFEDLTRSREEALKLIQIREKKMMAEDLDKIELAKLEAAIFANYMSLCLTEYSLGIPLDRIKCTVEKAIARYPEGGSQAKYSILDHYRGHLQLVAFAILFELSDDTLKSVGNCWRELSSPQGGDALIDKLIASRIPTWGISKTAINQVYAKRFLELFDESDKDAASNQISVYLRENWIRDLRKCGSLDVDSLKVENYLFRGFWCFEAAAIVKALCLPIRKDFGEYFPYSFFGLDEEPSGKHNLIKPDKTWHTIDYSDDGLLQFDIPGSWVKMMGANFQITSPGEKIALNVTTYSSGGKPFQSFCQHIFYSKEKSMPWNQSVHREVKRFKATDGNELVQVTQEYEGVWPDDEGEITSYLTACCQIGEKFVNASFVGFKDELDKARSDIFEILASFRKPIANR